MRSEISVTRFSRGTSSCVFGLQISKNGNLVLQFALSHNEYKGGPQFVGPSHLGFQAPILKIHLGPHLFSPEFLYPREGLFLGFWSQGGNKKAGGLVKSFARPSRSSISRSTPMAKPTPGDRDLPGPSQGHHNGRPRPRRSGHPKTPASTSKVVRV